MSSGTAFLFLLAVVILSGYKLIDTALSHKRNVRAGARLGPSSFFLEVTDQKMDQIQSTEK